MKKNKLTGKWADIGDGGKSGAIEKAARLLRETSTANNNEGSKHASSSLRLSTEESSLSRAQSQSRGIGRVFNSAKNVLRSMSNRSLPSNHQINQQQHQQQRMSYDSGVQTSMSDARRSSNFSNQSIPVTGNRGSNFRDSNFSMGSFNPNARISGLSFGSNNGQPQPMTYDLLSPHASMSSSTQIQNRLSNLSMQSNLTQTTNRISSNSYGINNMMQQQQGHMNNIGPSPSLMHNTSETNSAYISHSNQNGSGIRDAAALFLPDQEQNIYNQQRVSINSNPNQTQSQPYYSQLQNEPQYSSGRGSGLNPNQAEKNYVDFREEFRRQFINSKQTGNSSRSIRDLATLSARKLGANINWNSMRSVKSDVTWDEPIETLDDEQLDYIVESLRNNGEDVDDLSTNFANTSLSGTDTRYSRQSSKNGNVLSRGLLRKMSSSDLSIHTHNHRSAKHRRNLSDESNIYKAMLKTSTLAPINQSNTSLNNRSAHVRSASDTSLPMYSAGSSYGLFDPIPVDNLGTGDRDHSFTNAHSNSGSFTSVRRLETAWAPHPVQSWQMSNDLSIPMAVNSDVDNSRKSDRVSFDISHNRPFSQREGSGMTDFQFQMYSNASRTSNVSNLSGLSALDRSSWASIRHSNSVRGSGSFRGSTATGSPQKGPAPTFYSDRIPEEPTNNLEGLRYSNGSNNAVDPLDSLPYPDTTNNDQQYQDNSFPL